MSDSPPSPDEFPLESPSARIDRVCDRFEAAIRDGRAPQIEDFLASYPELDRLALLRELIGLELDLLYRTGETLTFDIHKPQGAFEGYHRRFPEATALLNDLQKDWELRVASKSELKSPAVGFDPEIETIDHTKPAPRRHIKQFELQSILGRGGFGIVWRARDMRLQRDVAVKVPRSDRIAASDRTMFLREARAAAKLRHPNIIAIHEVGEDDSEIFIVSELIEGVSLKVWLESNKLTPDAVAQMVAKLAKAVHHAHDKKIVHRDLKPANVLIDQQGEPHVADFGLAKREAGEESISVSGQIIGTPAYMAPEQARGDHAAIDPRTDVYALGAIFYELLTGKRPFRGELHLILEQVKNSQPEAPRLIKPDIPRELEAICLKCLAKDPTKRYVSAAALAEDLHLYLAGETLRGIPAALPNRMWKWFNRHRRFVVAIGFTFLLAVTVAGAFAWQFRGTKPIPLDLREVEFTTNPEGCEITVVPIDAKTGDPDPSRIQRAEGLSPLVMQLPASDYLVVAVLDETRFHEVYRNVPARGESVPFGDRSKHWKVSSSGVLSVQEIRIPRSDVTIGMGMVEKSDWLAEPIKNPANPERKYQIPSFFVDLSETSTDEVENWGLKEHGAAKWAALKARVPPFPGVGPGPHAQYRFYDAVWRVERQGKRLPSAAELYYLSNVICPPAANKQDISDTCVLPDQSSITGLHSGAWEWTTTKPSGPFSGMKLTPETISQEIILRMTGCGPSDPKIRTGFKAVHEPILAGVRGIRSSKPRRRPQDFIIANDNIPGK